MIGYKPFLGQVRLGQPVPPLPPESKPLSSVGVPPFDLPMVPSGILLTLGGLASGAFGTYLAMKGSQVIGKKVPTFWQWYFGTGGIGATMAILGAIPLVALGVVQLAGGIIIKKKLDEVGGMFQGLQPK